VLFREYHAVANPTSSNELDDDAPNITSLDAIKTPSFPFNFLLFYNHLNQVLDFICYGGISRLVVLTSNFNRLLTLSTNIPTI
jgi:hypothetical protein